MTQSSPNMQAILSRLDYKKPLHQSLANLQRILQSESISATSKLGLDSFEMVCQEYINISQGKGSRIKQLSELLQINKGQSHAKSEQVKGDTVLLIEKEKALIKVIKRNSFRKFVQLARIDEEMIKQQNSRVKKVLKAQTAKFHYRIKIASKFMQALKENYEESIVLAQKADAFLLEKQQIILEEYFLAWKEESLMTTAEREFRQQIEQKYDYLAKALFFRRLKANKDTFKQRKTRSEQLQSQLEGKIMQVSISSFFHRLKKSIYRQESLEQKKQIVSMMQKKKLFQNFIKTNNKFKIYRNMKDTNREQFITKTLNSRIFFRKLSTLLQIRKGYFKSKPKIIFITYLLQAITQSLRRKGYEYSWMDEMTPCLQFIDSKLNFHCRKFRLARMFDGLRQQLKEQRDKIEEVRLMRSGQILKQIIYNFKLSIVKQKEQHKIEAIQTIQIKSIAHRVIDAFLKTGSLRKRQTLLGCYISSEKLKRSMSYLREYYRSSKYYSTKLTAFLERKYYKEIYVIFNSIKTVLITQRVNNRIVQEYRNYTNHKQLQQIFQCLRDFTFNEQLIKKREKNVMRVRLREYADRLFYNLKIDLYAGMKERYNKIVKNQKKVEHLRRVNAFEHLYHQYKEGISQSAIEVKIDEEYKLRFQWKFFNLLKVITQRRQKERRIVKKIQEKERRRSKERAFDSIVSSFLLSLILKKIDESFIRKMKGYGLQQLKVAKSSRKSIGNLSDIQESEENSSLIHNT